MQTFHQQVLDFRYKVALPVAQTTRLLQPQDTSFYARFVMEELGEFLRAHEEQDITAAADALGDMIYLLHGCAHHMGVPIEAVLQAIHKANMQKVPGDSKRGKRDAIKPEGWVSPDADIRAALDKGLYKGVDK